MLKKHKKLVDPNVERWRHFKKLMSKNENHLLFTGFVMLMTALVVLLSYNSFIKFQDRDSRKDDSRQPNSQFAENTVLSSAQKFGSRNANINISNVTTNSDEDKAFALDPSNQYLIMDISITNNSGTVQDFYPTKHLYVRDIEGGYYPLHPSMKVTKPLGSGSIKPNETLAGEISFAIPKNVSNPKLYVDLGWNNMSPVVYSVLK
jgi:Domain of unknown function (DUF4352)